VIIHKRASGITSDGITQCGLGYSLEELSVLEAYIPEFGNLNAPTEIWYNDDPTLLLVFSRATFRIDVWYIREGAPETYYLKKSFYLRGVSFWN
jgi:hypothetical protein